nr:MAG TPA: waglerin family protein [Caudoviricetes sp.]
MRGVPDSEQTKNRPRAYGLQPCARPCKYQPNTRKAR